MCAGSARDGQLRRRMKNPVAAASADQGGDGDHVNDQGCLAVRAAHQGRSEPEVSAVGGQAVSSATRRRASAPTKLSSAEPRLDCQEAPTVSATSRIRKPTPARCRK